MYRIYAAPMIGDGSAPTPEAARRCVVVDHLQPGEDATTYDHPSRGYAIALVEASEATHNTIAGLTGVVVLSPLAANRIEFGNYLDQPLSSFPSALTTALLARLESNGINTSWANGTTTLRAVLRYLRRVITIAQRIDAAADTNFAAFLQADLSVQVNQLSVPVRSAVQSWMQGRGLAIGWINNLTTVREIVHFIQSNLDESSILLDGAEL